MMKNLNRIKTFLFVIVVTVLLSATGSVLGQKGFSAKDVQKTQKAFIKEAEDMGFPILKGGNASISSIDPDYCSKHGQVDIVPDAWDPSAASITWAIRTNLGSVEFHPSWADISGSGQTTVLEFHTDRVDPKYYGIPIYFDYYQYDAGGGPLAVGSDYTVMYLTPTAFDLSANTSICIGQSATLTLDSCEIGINYQLKDGDGNSIGFVINGDGNAIDFVVTPTVTTDYYVESVNSTDNTCQTTMNNVVEVIVNPLPIVTVSGDNNVCVGDEGVTYSTQPGMNNYIWTISSGGTITAGAGSNEITVTWNTAGAQSVAVNYDNLAGCDAQNPTTYGVTVNAPPTPIITGDNGVCAGDAGVTYATEVGMSNYVWAISAGGTITAGAASNEITVTWNTAGAQTVSVNYDNTAGCDAPGSTVFDVTVNALPVPVITGDADVCAGDIGVTYATAAGMSNYVWTISAGGTITAGSGSNEITVTWNTAGAQTVSVNYDNAVGCDALAPTVYGVTVNVIPAPVITGDNDVCAGDMAVTYATAAGMSNYVWTISSGGTITAGSTSNEITVTWNTAGAQTVSVNYDNAVGCDALAPTVYGVTVNALPAPVISGDNDVCAGDAGLTYTTDVGMSNYVWTISSGGTITAGSTSNEITVTWNTAGAQTVSVNYDNALGCDALAPTVYGVTVNALPIPVITGDNDVCAQDVGVTYATSAGMSNYVWTISAGGTITAGAGSNEITVTWNTAGAQTVSVNYDNVAGCKALSPTIYGVTVNALPAPVITGDNDVCAGDVAVTYATAAGMNNYVWTISAGGTITSGSGSNEITVTWNTAGAQTVSVNYENLAGCVALTPTVYGVTVNVLPAPVITGDNDVCAGDAGLTYTTDAGNSNYVWTISSGGTITAGAGSNEITVTWNTAGAQTVSVNYDNALGCDALAPTVYGVTVNALPIPVISGDNDVCAQDAGLTYATDPGMSNYVWTISAGGTITAGAGSNEVTVTWNTAGAQTISVNYDNLNGCTALIPTVYGVAVNALPAPVITGDNDVCAQDAGLTYTTESGMSNYVWTISAGGTITAGAGSNEITVTWNTAGAQTVSVNYDNLAGCAALTPTVYGVTVNALPSPVITGDNDVCAADAGVIYTTDAGMSNYVWTISSGGTITAGAGSNEITVTWNTAGAQTVSVNYDNLAGCDALAATTYNVTVNQVTSGISVSAPAPGLTTICAGTSVTFNASATDGSGNYTYDFHIIRGGVDGSVQDGPAVTYTTTALLDGDEVYVVVTDVSTTCTDVSGSIIMTVISNPVPTLNITSPGGNVVCLGTDVTFVASPSGFSRYVFMRNGTETLQDGVLNTLSTNVLLDGDEISVIAYVGTCFGNSPLVTMSVYDLPTVSIVADKTTVCDSEVVTFSATPTGTGPFNYQYFVDDVPQGIQVSNEFTYSSTNNFSVYVQVYDGNNCNAPSAAIDITISKPVAGLSADVTTICDGTEITFSATGGVSYEFFVGTNSEQGPGVEAEYKTSSLINGEIVSVQVVDAFGCAASHVGIPITVTGVPVASLTSSEIDNEICANDQVTFSATGGDVYEFYVNGNVAQLASGISTYVTDSLKNGESVTVLVSYSTSGCSSLSSEITTTVNPLPTATLTVSPSATIISGTNLVFTAGGGTDYEFSVLSGGSNSVLQSRSVDNTYDTDVLVNGDVVTVDVYDGNNCSSSESVTLTILDGVNILDVLSTATEYCEGDGGVSVYIATPQHDITYELIRTSDNEQETDSIMFDINDPQPIRWDNVSGDEEYRVEAYYSSVPAERFEMNNRVTIKENKLPIKLNLSPSGTVVGCNGGTGHTIYALDLSSNGFSPEDDVDYHLLRDGSIVQTKQRIGIAGSVTFDPVTTIGTYTMRAEKQGTGCFINFDESFIIQGDVTGQAFEFEVLDPAEFDNKQDGRYCEGTSGVEAVLSNSLNGIDYELYLNDSPLTTPVIITGTGGAISFGMLPIEGDGDYSVQVHATGGCLFPMNGVISVQEIPTPTAFNVTAENDGHYCEGEVGVKISVDNQEEDLAYILFYNATTPLDTIIGTNAAGTAITFEGTYGTEGVYSVTAKVPQVGCSIEMNNSINVEIDPLPIVYEATSDGDYCQGSSTYIYLADSESTVEYRWYNLDTDTYGAWKSGPGVLSFEIVSGGTYEIEARKKDGVTSCSLSMTGTFVIKEKSLPKRSPIISETYEGTGCGDGSILSVKNSELGVKYVLVKVDGSSFYPAAVDTILGNGGDIDFTPIVDSNNAEYTAEAILDGCSVFLANSAFVDIPGVVIKQTVTGSGEICNGDPGVVFGLADTEVGYHYRLYLADAEGSSTGVKVDSIMNSPGGAQSFALVNNEGEYFVIGSSPNCSLEMINRVNLNVNPLPIAYAMTGSGIFCDPTDEVLIGLEDSEEGVKYSLQYLRLDGSLRDTLNVTAGSSTGAFDFGSNFTKVGTKYSVVAVNTFGCSSSMNGTVTIEQLPAPINQTIERDGIEYCAGSGGVELRLTDHEEDVIYQVINLDDNSVVKEVIGTGTGLLSLGNVAEGTYRFEASHALGSCALNIADTVTIIQLDTPLSYKLVSDVKNVCGSEGVTINLEDSEDDREYRIEDSTGAILDTITNVDRDPISWLVTEPFSGSEIYEVIAMSGGTCDLSMGTIEITYNELPEDVKVFTIGDELSYCEGTDGISIGIENTQKGVAYFLVDTIDVDVVLDVVIGDGNSQTFTKYFGSGGYTVNTLLYTTGCFKLHNDTIKIEQFDLPQINSELICGDEPGSSCSVGDALCISPSEVDVEYELYKDGVSTGEIVEGDGNIVCFNPIDEFGIYTLQARTLTSPECVSTFDGSIEFGYSVYGVLRAADDLINVPADKLVDTLNVRFNDTLSYVEDRVAYMIPYGAIDVTDPDIFVVDRYIEDYGFFESPEDTSNVRFTLLTYPEDTTSEKEVQILEKTGVGIYSIDKYNGSFIYKKAPGFFGKDSVRYIIKNTEYLNLNRVDTATITIYAGNEEIPGSESFLIPNAFSPNNDHINDLYVISGKEGGINPSKSQLEVFNRWGVVVFRSKGTNYGDDDNWWDGKSTTSNMVSIGSDLPNGTYFYLFSVEVNVEGEVKTNKYSGYVELRR